LQIKEQLELTGQLTPHQDLFQTTVELVDLVIFYLVALEVVGVKLEQYQHLDKQAEEEHKHREVEEVVDLQDTLEQFTGVELEELEGHLPQQLSVDYLWE
jgi:hypothetical protein